MPRKARIRRTSGMEGTWGRGGTREEDGHEDEEDWKLKKKARGNGGGGKTPPQ